MMILSFFLSGCLLWAAPSTKVDKNIYYSGDHQQQLSLEHWISQIQPGEVLLIGEQHYQTDVAQQIQLILEELVRQGHQVSIGMEFIDYLSQESLDRYLHQQISEEVFLKEVSWGGDFNFYREIVQFPIKQNRGYTWGINAPRWLTRKVSQGGLEALSPEELSLLPPQFQRGRAVYFERFKNLLSGLKDPQKIERYFLAQSIWDDTMAYQIGQLQSRYPQQTLVVVVGAFHVQYNGGLGDRLRARSGEPLAIKSLVLAPWEQHLEFQTPQAERPADWLWYF